VVSTGLGIAFGILLGLRHAFEPDHLTAVSALVTDTHDMRGGAVLGALWGLGHTISLVAVAAILMLVGASMPVRASIVFELCVAVMLLVLGARSIVVAVRVGATHRHDHSPHGRRHAPTDHDHSPHGRRHAPTDHVHLGARTLAWRPLVVGVVHGLAGSGALTAIVFASLHGTGARLLYVALFGVGSIGGMALASGVAGATLHGLAHADRTRRVIAIAAGALSIVVGVCWTIPLWLQLA
jgi:ABC-type nickel/cobalt efflux system permease component RcnA